MNWFYRGLEKAARQVAEWSAWKLEVAEREALMRRLQ